MRMFMDALTWPSVLVSMLIDPERIRGLKSRDSGPSVCNCFNMQATSKLGPSFATLALAVTLAGCSTAAPATVQATKAPAPSSTATLSAAPASAGATAAPDEVTCAAFGDVVTILGNVDVAFNEDRMGEQERRGWYALATRVLANIPSADEGPVAEALAALKAEVPAVQGTTPTDFGTPGGPVFGADLYDACKAAGFQVTLSAFTGG